ncbi:MAG: cob(I)yrinic acid a,c-diamide adenosyltransferase [Candidatus Adiutrix sp.]|jgi:cob(I)alamin adenosyltransferase|nr:cob(I)yrinic acid a,c-diamide adenosyltransferase [Candidatus Adiutrix sp.]
MGTGLILVNTGPGKGKTTAALGTAIRALGQGFKVAFLQFIKNQETGESLFLKAYAQAHPDRLYYNRLGLGCLRGEPAEEDLAKAAEAMAEADELLRGDYGLVVLDEICVAMARGLIKVEAATELIRSRPAAMNLILTGRGCPDEIIALADTVTEMKVLKHAYENGVPARRGLEF